MNQPRRIHDVRDVAFSRNGKNIGLKQSLFSVKDDYFAHAGIIPIFGRHFTFQYLAYIYYLSIFHLFTWHRNIPCLNDIHLISLDIQR